MVNIIQPFFSCFGNADLVARLGSNMLIMAFISTATSVYLGQFINYLEYLELFNTLVGIALSGMFLSLICSVTGMIKFRPLKSRFVLLFLFNLAFMGIFWTIG